MSRNGLIHRANAILFAALLIKNHLCHVLINIGAKFAQSSITKAEVQFSLEDENIQSLKEFFKYLMC